MNPNLHSYSVSLEPYVTISKALEDPIQGFQHIQEQGQEEHNSRFSQFQHIENQCKQFSQDQCTQFVSTIQTPPIYYPKIIPTKACSSNGVSFRTQIEQSQGSSNHEFCTKCQKINKNLQVWSCPECQKLFHFECLPKHQRSFYADQQDPHFTIPQKDLINGTNSISEIQQEDIKNYYEVDGHYLISNEVVIHGAVYCPDCFEKSCHSCRGGGDTLSCVNCGVCFHAECAGVTEINKRGFVCELCKIDGGISTVDKILSIKVLSREELEHVMVEQLKKKYEQYNETLSFKQNYDTYMNLYPMRVPTNIYLADRIYFLVKLNFQSYWRVKWIAHSRIQYIARARLSAVNLLNCLTVYKGIEREFGLDRVVQMNEINTKLGIQQSNEILKVFDSDSEESGCQTEFQEPEDNKYVSNSKLAEGFENYMQVNPDDFVMTALPPKYQNLIKQYLEMSPQFVQDSVVNYAKVLHTNGVPPSFLIPDQIIARNNTTFLVRWLGGNFEESTFESVYFLLPYGRTQILQFLIDTLGVKRNSLFQLIGLSLSQKTWVEQREERIVKGRLGEYRPLIATPPYLALGGKNLYDFQLLGINWLLFTHNIKRGVLFCDQMGLGKSIQVCGFLASLTEYGCFGTHLIICPTSTINNWVRELRKWVPFLSLGLIEVTDTVGIEYVIRTGIKGAMRNYYDSQSDVTVQDVGVTFNQTNSDSDAECRSSRQRLMDYIVEITQNKENNEKRQNTPEEAVSFQFASKNARQFNGSKHFDIIIMSYETTTNLMRKKIDPITYKDKTGKFYTQTYPNHWQALLQSQGPFSTLICDEGHRLKGGLKNQVYAVLDHIKAKQRVILTGTPVQNNFEEFVNLLSFIEPNVFTEPKCVLLTKYAEDASSLIIPPEQRKQSLALLHEMVKPHVLIRSHKDVFADPVTKAEILIPVDMTKRQKLIYSKMLYDDRFKLTEKRLFKQRASMLRNTAVSLRHVCNHPVLLDRRYAKIVSNMEIEEFLDMSAKMKMVDRLLIGIHKRCRKVLIFSQFVMVLNVLEILLKKREYNFCRLDGSVHSSDRQQLIDRFNDPANNITVFILSTNSGGMGINLQAAQDVIIFDASWNPQNDLQAMHRAARIGQTQIVRVYKIFCRDTIDQRILERAKQKLSLSYILVKPLQGIGKVDDNDNLDDVLAFGCQNILTSFRDMNADLVKMADMFQGGIDFESQEFKDFMKSVDDKVIEYNDEEVNRLLDMEPVELANEQAKAIHVDGQNQKVKEGGALDKNDFFAAFRVAEFKVTQKEQDDENESTVARDRKKQVIQAKPTGIVADNTRYWTELFTKTFGGDVLKNQQKPDEQTTEITEIDSDLSVFKQSDKKKQNILYIYDERQIPVIRFNLDVEKEQYKIFKHFVQNTTNSLIDVSNKSSYQFDLNETTVRQVQAIRHFVFQGLPNSLLEASNSLIKYAFASPVLCSTSINHRELYKLQFEHQFELDQVLLQYLEIVQKAELKIIENLLQSDNEQIKQLKQHKDFENLQAEIQRNIDQNTCFVYQNVFAFSRKDSNSIISININDGSLQNDELAVQTDLKTYLKQLVSDTFLSQGTRVYCISLLSFVPPGKFDPNLTLQLRNLVAYYLKLSLTQIDYLLTSVQEIQFSFNVIFFRKIIVEIYRKFLLSGSNFEQIAKLTNLDVAKTCNSVVANLPQSLQMELRPEITSSGNFSLELIQPELRRLYMVLAKQEHVVSKTALNADYDEKLREKLLPGLENDVFKQFCNQFIVFTVILGQFFIVNENHIMLFQQQQKYIHIINYNDELDAEYDLLQKTFSKPKPVICVQKYNNNNSQLTEKTQSKIIQLKFQLTQIQLAMQSFKEESVSTSEHEKFLQNLQVQKSSVLTQIELLQKQTSTKETAKYIFLDYIKNSVLRSISGVEIQQPGKALCKHQKGQKEGFWHPADSLAFGVDYQNRKKLWNFFAKVGFPVDLAVFRLYKSKLGQQGAIKIVTDIFGENFDEKFVQMNQFFRDRMIALFEAQLSLNFNQDPNIQKCENYVTLLNKNAPVVWKNLPFDFFITQFSKEQLFLLLFTCAVHDGCQHFLVNIINHPDGEKGVLEALFQLPIISAFDHAPFGFVVSATEPLPMFTKNRVVCNERRRKLIIEQFTIYVTTYLPKLSLFLPSTTINFIQKLLDNEWYSLFSGLIILTLNRYGLANFEEFALRDTSIGLGPVLQNLIKNTPKVKSERIEKSQTFIISDPAKLFQNTYLSERDKASFLAAILSVFLLGCQFSLDNDWEKKCFQEEIQVGSKDVWSAMGNVLGKSWGMEYQECVEMKGDVENVVRWFSEFKFSNVISECYKQNK
ncbi:Chromodomain helicase-DNA-binding protein [Spironucleus salmonicida]|uniref:Chromodomain helicase-DNA-binding protein n=1 Tax=Spironucleus salmonicida TaxID=348837 RepID=V6LG44_9EUKA|nr:Chromodomain helicase-DNA-binding protein [Spironucleus salmonicida]|eukprot:EST43248.1 Chromodomain helicase-DNA-binding protein [Spironucleus salmonicida]